MPSSPGQLVILSGPSGVGKTTVVKRLLSDCPLPLVLSVSATTRAPRDGEQDGVDYHFLTPDEFEQRRLAGEFIECCEVYGRGDWYGTLKSEVDGRLLNGKWVMLEIDVEGAMRVVEQRNATTIFIRPDSMEELERRLQGRRTETAERIRQRLARARHEFSFSSRYQYCVVNQDLDQTVRDICQILQQLAAHAAEA